MSKHKVTKRDSVIFVQELHPTISINDIDYYIYSTEDELCCNLIVIYDFMVRKRRKTRNLLLRYYTPDEKD